MVNIYLHTDYRVYLKQLLKFKTQVQLAKAMDCQAAYLSQVLKEKASLTEDHGFKLCHYLEFSDHETEYFLILLRHSRAGSHSLIQYLEKKRNQLKEHYLELNERLSSEKKNGVDEMNIFYCSSWIPSALHSATSCDGFQTINSLASRFNMDKSTVQYYLQQLEKFNLVRFEKNKWVFNGGSLHFPKNSSMDQTFQTHQRIHALHKLSERQPLDIHYSSVLSIDLKTSQKIKEIIISTLAEVHKVAEPAESQDVHTLCIDFFKT